jgi:hypothetical protein
MCLQSYCPYQVCVYRVTALTKFVVTELLPLPSLCSQSYCPYWNCVYRVTALTEFVFTELLPLLSLCFQSYCPYWVCLYRVTALTEFMFTELLPLPCSHVSSGIQCVICHRCQQRVVDTRDVVHTHTVTRRVSNSNRLTQTVMRKNSHCWNSYRFYTILTQMDHNLSFFNVNRSK